MALLNLAMAAIFLAVGACLGFGIAALCVAASDKDMHIPRPEDFDEEYEGEN